MSAARRRVPDRVRGIPNYVCYLRCDQAGCLERIAGRAREARSRARHLGWQTGPPDYCSTHRRDET